MTETLDPMAATEVDQKQLAEQLLAQAKEQGVELMGPNGLLNQLTKNVLETALDAEIAEHLGYEKHDSGGRGSGNSRNGTRAKTVLTEIGPVEIDVPRDTDSLFAPQIVKKRQRRLTGIDEIVLSLTAKGLTTGEVSTGAVARAAPSASAVRCPWLPVSPGQGGAPVSSLSPRAETLVLSWRRSTTRSESSWPIPSMSIPSMSTSSACRDRGI